MIYSILLLLILTSCVSGSFVMNVRQTSYQAEDNHNITLEWMFSTSTDSSPNSLFIFCKLFADLKASVLFHLDKGVEVPESQDKQFTGRVHCDKDVLREGRIRLHMSRLRINDSGVYQCEMHTGYGWGSEICQLKVTAAADEPRPPTPTMSPQPESWGWIVLYVVLIAGLLALCAGLCYICQYIRGNSDTAKEIQAAKKGKNTCETCCPKTNCILKHSTSLPTLESLRLMYNSNCSRSVSNLNYSRSRSNFNYSSSMGESQSSNSLFSALQALTELEVGLVRHFEESPKALISARRSKDRGARIHEGRFISL